MVDSGDEMMAASTMVPVPTFMPLSCSTRPFFGEERSAKLVLLQCAAELQQRGAVGNAFAPQVDPHKPPRSHAVEQHVFAGLVRQVEPVLHEVHVQHAHQTHRWATVANLGIVRLDQRAKLGPRHDAIHLCEELIATGRPAIAFAGVALIGCNGECLLLLMYRTHDDCVPLTSFSVAPKAGASSRLVRHRRPGAETTAKR